MNEAEKWSLASYILHSIWAKWTHKESVTCILIDSDKFYGKNKAKMNKERGCEEKGAIFKKLVW
jgi:hypothetical protein